MIRLIKKDFYTEYVLEINKYGLTLIAEILTLLDKGQSNPEIACMSYKGDLLQELQ